MLPRLNRSITIGQSTLQWPCNDLSQEALFGVWACSPSEFQTFSDTILESLHKNTLRISRQIMLFVIILLTSLSLSYARILPYQGLSQLAQTWTARSPVQQAMGQIPTQKACRVNSPSPHPGLNIDSFITILSNSMRLQIVWKKQSFRNFSFFR